MLEGAEWSAINWKVVSHVLTGASMHKHKHRQAQAQIKSYYSHQPAQTETQTRTNTNQVQGVCRVGVPNWKGVSDVLTGLNKYRYNKDEQTQTQIGINMTKNEKKR